MGLDDLKQILTKAPVITTMPADMLINSPEKVRETYTAYALTHMPLGDTEDYVKRIFKYLGGGNKTAFIGGVVGDYGHGKTSFQIHVWHQANERKVLAVPPFEWKSLADVFAATDAWVRFVLAETNPEKAQEAKLVHDRHVEHGLRQMAEDQAVERGEDAEAIFKTLSFSAERGGIQVKSFDEEAYLGYIADLTVVIRSAGWNGLLVLLDEPEVAARALSIATVSLMLFGLANGLLMRQGDFGMFVSMPENFLAQVQQRYSALPARLQACDCLPRLRDMYGADFAGELWERYVRAFGLQKHGAGILTPEALVSIGQVCAEQRPDLSYGPRSVISSLQAGLHHHLDTKKAYEPRDYVHDCVAGRVMVNPDYATRLNEVLESPGAKPMRSTLELLGAFPNGIDKTTAVAIGCVQEQVDQAYRNDLVYRRGSLVGLRGLERAGGPERDELRDAITDIMDQYAPSPEAFSAACDSFVKYIVPRVFEDRQGHQLQGWDISPWSKPSAKCPLRATIANGAFPQTVGRFPKRNFALGVSSADGSTDVISHSLESLCEGEGIQCPDVVVHWRLRWSAESSAPSARLSVSPGNVSGDEAERRPAWIEMTYDLLGRSVEHDSIDELLDERLRTPLALLYLMHEMSKYPLSHSYQGYWQAMLKSVVPKIVAAMTEGVEWGEEAGSQLSERIPGSPSEWLAQVAGTVLGRRYPDYVTLIRQPQWQSAVQPIIRALRDSEVPLAAKRGNEPWQASTEACNRAFGQPRMNLTGGALEAYNNLVTIKSQGRADSVKVEFKPHPLEQRILDAIVSGEYGARKKIDGKECWVCEDHKLAPMLLTSGYQTEELQTVFQLGEARGLFRSRNGLLYVEPLDIEQMRTHLLEKLAELEDETGAFQQLSWYESNLDFVDLQEQIEAVNDDTRYERLRLRLNKAFEDNHQRLPGYFGRLHEDSGRALTSLQQVAQGIAALEGSANLKAPPKGSSAWCAALSKYIYANLRILLKETESRRKQIQTGLAKLQEKSQFRPQVPVPQQVEILMRACEGLQGIQVAVGQLQSRQKSAQERSDEYGRWLSLLRDSDDLYGRLTDLRNEPAHAQRAGGFLQDLESIWASVDSHLQQRNLEGLGALEQYRSKISDLDKRRQDYLSQLRQEFLKTKERLEKLMKDTGMGPDARCKEVFNSDDLDGCYSRLFEEAGGLVDVAAASAGAEIAVAHTELIYARDITNTLPPEKANPALARLDAALVVLGGLPSGTEIMRQSATPQSKGTEALRDVLAEARECVHVAKTAYREADAEQRKISSPSRAVLDLLPKQGPMNLKDLAIAMLKGEGQPDQVLEGALEALAELFRAGKLQVRVERTSR